MNSLCEVWDVLDLSGTDFVFLQELGGLDFSEQTWKTQEIDLGGRHMLFYLASPVNSFRGQAVGIPLDMANRVTEVRIFSAGLALRLKQSGIQSFLISMHLPHSQREDCLQVWTDMMHATREFTARIRMHDTIVIGADTNYELLEHVPRTHQSDERAMMWQTLKQELGLSSTTPGEATWSNTRGASSRIDFLCYRSPGLDTVCQTVVPDSDRLLGSDHKAVTVGFRALRHPRTKERKHQTHKCGKWRVNVARALEEFDAAPLQTNPQAVLQGVAGKTTFRDNSCRYRDPPPIKDLIQRRKRTAGAQARALALEIVHMRAQAKKAWMEEILVRSSQGDFTAISYLKKRQSAQSTQSSYIIRAGGEDRAIADLRSFYKRKYTPQDPAMPGLAEAMFLSRAGKLEKPRDITVEEVLATLARCKHGKSTGMDGIPYELIQVMMQSKHAPSVAVFLTEVLNNVEPVPEEWLTGQVALLPKKQEPRAPKDLRPICLSAAMGKIFTKILWSRIRTHCSSPRANQLSGIDGAQGLDGAATVQHVVRLSQEWGEPLVAMRIDISQAFDTLRHEAVSTWLASLGPLQESHALLKVILATSICISFGAARWTQKLHQGLLQGSPYSAELFSRVLDWFVGIAYDTWEATESTWLRNGDRKLFCVIYADDLVLFATSHEQMRRMLEHLNRLLASIGLRIALEKCAYLQSNDLPDEAITVDGTTIPKVPHFIFLGVLIGFGVQCQDVLAARLVQTVNSFHGYYSILTRADSPIRKRLQLLNTFVTSRWRWMSGCIRPVTAVKNMLDRLHTNMLVSMCRLKDDVFAGVTGNWVVKRRASRMIAQLVEHATWSGTHAQMFFRYWGHAARRTDGSNPVYQAINIRSSPWQWTNQDRRRVLGFWPNTERFLQLAWTKYRQPAQPFWWAGAALDRQIWSDFSMTWLQTKNLMPQQHYRDLSLVDLQDRMLLQMDEVFTLMPMRHQPVEEPYPANLQVMTSPAFHAHDEVECAHTLRFVTDGSARCGVGGWAVVMATPLSELSQAILCYGKLPGKSTNIRAEIAAISHAFRLAKEFHHWNPSIPIEVWSDSLFVIHVLEDRYYTALNAMEMSEAQQLWCQVSAFVRLRHVRAHTGIALNELADTYAKHALSLQHTRRVFRTQDFRRAHFCDTRDETPQIWMWES